MQLLSADVNLCIKAEFEAVSEARRCIDVYSRGIDFAVEMLAGKIIVRHDGFRMAGAVMVDVTDGLV